MAANFDIATEVKEDETYTKSGFVFPLSCLFSQASIERALTYRPSSCDVLLSSYPKCDSHVVDSIVWKLLYMDLQHPPVCSTTESFIPCMEMSFYDSFVSEYELMSKRLLPKLRKTYFPLKVIPFYKCVKYIYVMRTPWDACTSYYALLRLTQADIESFDAFFDAFLQGKVPYGSYFKHIIPWNKKIQESNVLVLCREHVEHNPRSAMFAIAAFLGDRYLKQLIDNRELEESILNAIGNADFKGKNYGFRDSSKPCNAHPRGDCARYRNDIIMRGKLKPSCNEMQLKHMIEAIAGKFKDSSTEYMWLSLLKKQAPGLFN